MGIRVVGAGGVGRYLLVLTRYLGWEVKGGRDIRDDTRFGEDDLDDWIGSI